MKGYCCFVSIFLLVLQSSAFGQEGVIDSLNTALSTADNDTARIKILHQLARQYHRQYPDTTIAFCRQAIELSEQSNYVHGLAKRSTDRSETFS